MQFNDFLGAAIGTKEFKQTYLQEKVEEWCKSMRRLSKIAASQPQAAYTAFIFGEQHKYTYFMRIIKNIAEIMKPLDDVITNEFIPALFGREITSNDREILSLPIREGGLGIQIQHEIAESSYYTSTKITAPLVSKIKEQYHSLPCQDVVNAAKSDAIKLSKYQAEEKYASVKTKQDAESKRNLEQLSERGSSSWLGAIPLKDQGFNLNKSEFQDALNLRYDKPLKHLPSNCACGQKFTITHAMNCHRGGFINARHDNIRNFEAQLLKQVCNDVEIEPQLQPICGATFHRSANVRDDARLDVRVTNADNNSQITKPLKTVLRSHEQEKKRQYNSRVMEIEHGTFTPLVITVKGVIAPEANRFHKTLAEKIAIKSGERYDDVNRLIRIKMSFLVIKAALLCIRGSRRLQNNDNSETCDDFSYNLNELRIQ